MQSKKFMSKNLLIVESPAKAKTIEKYLGKGFIVESSYGHVRDLAKGNDAVDVEHDFTPKYIVSPDKKKLVTKLKGLVKKVDEVWLATDEDREGEAISWHLCEVLGLDPSTTKRIVFHEITKPAILKAVSNPRTVNIPLVDAQQARRILDRLVGYELSEMLWRKIRGKLSAGRVQSVAVKLVVDREREINKFETTSFYKLKAFFDVKNEKGKTIVLEAVGPDRIENSDDAQSLLKKCIGASYSIKDINVKPLKRRPSSPFTTSTLQQEASRKLHFSVKKTMMLAQRLYEAGHITYMRTDSTNLSETAIQAISAEIESAYGSDYLKVRRYKTKKAGAQEAHEAIRPTYIQKHNVTGDRDLQRLYDLIWKRTIASQMADAALEKTTADIEISTSKSTRLQAVGEVLKFDGFLKVYMESKDDDQDEDEAKGILPPLNIGQVLELDYMQTMQRFTRPPARYTEAGLVSKMEEKGIGRPSTYAPTISKIMDPERGYVVKANIEGVDRNYELSILKDGKITTKVQTEKTGAVKNRLMPTDMGMVVSDFLSLNFSDIMNYGFTAGIEKKFDEIASGKEAWQKILKDFYEPFHKEIEAAQEHAERPSGERILGVDPETGRTVLTRMSRRGPVVQIGTPEELEEGEKPKYGNLQAGQSMESITYEEAMKLFALPRSVGNYEGEEVVIGAGRYGPYVKYQGSFVSLRKDMDPFNVTLDEAIELIEEKKKADAPVTEYKGHPVTKGKGRFGPFLKWNSMYVNVPKKYDFDNLSKEEMDELIEAKIQKEANRYIKKWEKEKVAIENGRWGPFIRFGKKNVKIPKQEDGSKVTQEYAATLEWEDVKKIINEALPGSFKDKKKK